MRQATSEQKLDIRLHKKEHLEDGQQVPKGVWKYAKPDSGNRQTAAWRTVHIKREHERVKPERHGAECK